MFFITDLLSTYVHVFVQVLPRISQEKVCCCTQMFKKIEGNYEEQLSEQTCHPTVN